MFIGVPEPVSPLRNKRTAGKKYNQPFPEEVVWSYLIQTLRGLESLHAKKIIHRDIKPANIFIATGDIIKIGDLGVAKVLQIDASAVTQIGTPYYMVCSKCIQLITQKRQYIGRFKRKAVICLFYV